MAQDLMLRCYTELIFTQQPKATDGAVKRNKTITLYFCHTWECEENWTDLCNNAKIVIPKKAAAIDKATGRRYMLNGAVNEERFITNLFKRGDKVQIKTGYWRTDINNNVSLYRRAVFNGYISAVKSKMPITIEVEDNMWLLKQIPCKPQVWPKSKSVEDLLRSLLKDTDFTINALTDTTVGNLIIEEESVAQLLARLRKDYRFESYFATPQNSLDPNSVGNELRIGSMVYIPPDPDPKQVKTFVFQKNIISDDLIIVRRDEVKLSAVCESVNTVMKGGKNKAGNNKTKQERLQVLVWVDANGKWRYRKKEKNKDFPPNVEGERRTLHYPNVTDPAKLAQLGANELSKFYYDGFKGTFTTFAMPDIKLGDYIKIEDAILPDRTGFYVVKSVKKSGGVNGGRQVIEIAYRLVSKLNKLTNPTADKPIPG